VTGVLCPGRFWASASSALEGQLPIDSGDGSPEANHLGAGQELLPDGSAPPKSAGICAAGTPMAMPSAVPELSVFRAVFRVHNAVAMVALNQA